LAAVSANNIFAVTTAAIDHWVGTSWSIINKTTGFGATGVTALSAGTVVMVGENRGILEN
jgi:hypothetical protein